VGLRGYGDRSRAAPIQLLTGAREEATGFLVSNSETQSRLERVSALIEGFETPQGMELLATVHWLQVMTQPPGRIRMPPSGVSRRGTSARSSHSAPNMFGRRGSGSERKVGYRLPKV